MLSAGSFIVVDMWTYQHHHDTSAAADKIWPLYADVTRWSEWDPAMKRVDINGDFLAGSEGVMHVENFGPVPFVITDCTPNAQFSTDSPGPGVTIRFEHELEPLTNGGTRITHRVILHGPAAETVGPQMGPNMTSDLPESMAKIAELAEGL
jgi:Polyketide cyclase / dehydrase and lipid transport